MVPAHFVAAVIDAEDARLTCRWVTPGSLIFVENVQNVSFSPVNTFQNTAGCTYGDYTRPINLGLNAVDVAMLF